MRFSPKFLCLVLTLINIRGIYGENEMGFPELFVQEGNANVVKDEWSETVSYTKSCSFWSWGRCTAYKTVWKHRFICASGYTPWYDNIFACENAICDKKIDETGACTIRYSDDYIKYKNGTIRRDSGGWCDGPEKCGRCMDGFYSDGPYCRICPKIDNCWHRRCSTTSNNKCMWCHGTVSEKQYYRAYTTEPSNRDKCQQACSWRSDSTRCFPGTCAQELAENCQCTTGFTGKHCEQMTEYASITYNEAILRDPSNQVKVNPPDAGVGPPQETAWTNNLNWNSLYTKLAAKYTLSGIAPSISSDHYIKQFDYGIKYVLIKFTHTRGGSAVNSPLEYTCPTLGMSERKPKKEVHCDHTFSLNGWRNPFTHNDKILFDLKVDIGGYGEYMDREANRLKSWSLVGTTTTRQFEYHFDTKLPYQCIVTGAKPCADYLTSPDLTESSTISISWDGWEDDLSKLDYYMYELFILKGLSSLKESGGPVVIEDKIPNTTLSHSFQIPNALSGMYAIHFTAYDKAGNWQTSRKVFLFDDASVVEKDSNKKSWVSTASKDTNYLWVVQDTKVVTVKWTDRFKNHDHNIGGWLNKVETVAGVSDTRYDDHTGNRTIDAINNVWAVVDFKVSFTVYDENGIKDIRYLTSVADIQDQADTLTLDWDDGDKMETTIRAIDVLDKYAEENVTVYRDATPPIIEDLWLTRGDRLNVSVHRIEDFREMTIEWMAYDFHSGLDIVKWKLFDNYTGNDIMHGEEHILAQGNAQNMTACTTSYGSYPRGANCYCTPFWGCYHQHFQVKPEIKSSGGQPSGLLVGKDSGVHDSDYYLEVTVTSKAKLTTVLRKKITIDSSPPHTGIVHDGRRGNPEVDYQQDLTLHAYWDGFFDRESGVLFYQYGFDTSCIPKSSFQLDVNSSLVETYSLHATHTATTEGKYYITVVAYNRALEPSDPVCSDGVTIDTTTPAVNEVTIQGARVQGGLVTDATQTNYYVLGDNRIRRLISNPTADCVSKATVITDIDMLPLEKFENGTLTEVDGTVFCLNTSSALSNLDPMLSKSSMLYFEWKAVDNPSGVHDYEVGLSSTAGSAAPDILSFASSKQHAHFHIMHADVPDGTMFYIIIKTISKANVEGIQSIGPCFMDTTGPDISGAITVTYNNGYILASWGSNAILDPQDSYTLDLEFAVGHKYGSHDVHYYTPIQAVGPCTLTNPPTCTAIKVGETDWRLHGHHTYYVTIKAENSAGLVSYAVSDAYVHDVQLPVKGIVGDINPDVTSESQLIDIEDIDFQVSKNSLSARWTGFDHPHLDVTYKFSVGTTPGGTDVVAAKALGSVMQHTENGLSLTTLQTYYVTIEAISDAGNVDVTSDGVTVVEENYVLSGIVINDGVPCNLSVDTNFTHHQQDNRKTCEKDIDFQSSTSSLNAYWSIPANMKYYTRDIHFAIEEKLPLSTTWVPYRDFEHISTHYEARVTNLHLSPGKTYRFKIKICAITTCYSSITSDGVTILANSPVTGILTVDHLNTTQGPGVEQLLIQMQRFYDPDVQEAAEKYDYIDHYEWSISDQSAVSRTHLMWTDVTGATLSQGNTVMSFTLNLPGEFDFSKCRSFVVRGYNKAKLVSTISKEVKDCKAFNPILVIPNDVIDAVGVPQSTDGMGQPVYLDKNALWHLADRDYTPYHNYISAVWPRLRYHSYKIAVIHYKPLDITTYYKPISTLNLPDPCSHPDAISCASTVHEYHNFKFNLGELQHGERYMVCLHGDRTEIKHEKWLQILPDLNTCSDGVIVDLTPPVEGEVWITNDPMAEYQTSTSDMYVNWHSFRDVEEMNAIAHSSGIQDYQLGIGTSPGGNDMVAFYSVGVVNHVALHNLILQSGHIYYATIIAKDYANRTTTKTSSPVIVDTSSPVKNDIPITITGRHIVSKAEIEACWKGVFTDIESGIDYYMWGIGSEPGYDDVMMFTREIEECGENDKNHPLNLHEGHAYYISVKAYNKAGLMSLASSWAYVVDTSPPLKGHVYDGNPMTNPHPSEKDIDFQDHTKYLHAYWEGFNDPHTSIKEYYVSVGTCPGCSDVLEKQAIGIVYELHIYQIHFGPGLTYYTSVTACNSADLCTTSTSDGLIMDDSAPSTGLVFDGTASHDIEYQSLRTYIGAKWYGFADPQSGLYKYEWCAGTTPGGSDILPATPTHLTQVAVSMNLTSELPLGTRIYVTVKAYNYVGLSTQATSDGFYVDITGPVITKGPLFSSDFGIFGDTQIYRTSMKVQWEVTDAESFIERQYLSLKSHIGGEFDLASTKVNGIARDFVLTGLNLHDGVTYYVQLISCNGAQICNTSTSPGILVDSTPPNRGMFAIHTDHAAELERHVDSWMTWSSEAVYLAWLGFADIHSDIDYYGVYVGSSYMAADLNKEPGEVQTVSHSNTGVDKYDEGRIQTYKVETVKLVPSIKQLYITVWAVNKVGLSSALIHSQFEKIPGGTLSLVRRCQAITCEGHCVCAPQDKLCHTGTSCTDISSSNPNNLLSVADVRSGTADIDYTASDTVLRGAWTIVHRQGTAPQWYQWSVGLASESTPQGIFNTALERFWHDAGQNMLFIYTTKPGKVLTETVKYSFFLRVWYDSNTYAVFKSDGVVIATTPPRPTNIRGSSVNERMLNSKMKDQDDMKYGFPFKIDWENKFLDAADSISRFRVYLSTYPGGHDTFGSETDVPGNQYTYEIRRNYLKPGVKYYSNVIGYGLSGIHHTESSDGFKPDKVKPVAGMVYDGIGLHDLAFQNSSTVVSAHWHGFTDTGSGIVTYYWCVGSTTVPTECGIRQMEAVGLHVAVSRELTTPLSQNKEVFSKVYALDNIGYRSPTVVSNGVRIDKTPPDPQYLYHDEVNLLQNPSFEDSVINLDIADVNTTNICNLTSDHHPRDWEVSADSCASVVTSITNLARDGRSFVFVRGSIMQRITNLEKSKFYRLNFFSSHITISSAVLSNKEGFVKVGQERHVFMLHAKAYRRDGHGSQSRETVSWHRHTFYFEALDTEMNLTMGSVDVTTGIFIDGVTFELVKKDKDPNGGAQVAAHIVSLHEWGSIHGSWGFVEDVSHIKEYTWAIGYTEGGTQVQGFESAGTSTFAYNSSVILVHNSYIYVTVIATNTAGLQGISYSAPVLVDLTPPVITGVYDGRIIGEDKDAWTDNEVSVNWNVYDGESGLDYCEWAIGYQPDSIELRAFERVPLTTNVAYADIPYALLNQRVIYTTVRCYNKAGLITSASSDGVKISNVPPSITNAVVQSVPLSITEYKARENYQSNLTSIRMKWSGFYDHIEIDQYKVTLSGSDINIHEKMPFPSGQDVMYVNVLNLQTVPGLKEMSVSAINSLLLVSDVMSANITIFVDKPSKTGSHLQVSFDKGMMEFTVTWDGLFSSPHPLYYEVSAGKTIGGGEIVQWLETNATAVTFALPPAITDWPNLDVFLFVRAIAAGGLYEDIHGHIKLPS